MCDMHYTTFLRSIVVLLCVSPCIVLAEMRKWMDRGVPVWEPENNSTRFASARPKIYVYEFPAKYREDEKFAEIANGNPYSLDVLLPWMVKLSPYYTTNPEEADFFLGKRNVIFEQRCNGVASCAAARVLCTIISTALNPAD